jgi:hypothetical protein
VLFPCGKILIARFGYPDLQPTMRNKSGFLTYTTMSKKAKGFGQSPTPTRKFKDFLLAFGDFYRKNSRDETKLQQFLKANINKLDDLLLDALPFSLHKLNRR